MRRTMGFIPLSTIIGKSTLLNPNLAPQAQGPWKPPSQYSQKSVSSSFQNPQHPCTSFSARQRGRVLTGFRVM
jgi:hypothetical protein